MINFKENIADNLKYGELSDKDLKDKFDSLKNKNYKEIESDIILICSEYIKRLYNYEFKNEDFEILNNFLNQITTDISNKKAYYAFLVYTVLCHFQNKQLHCLFIDDLTARKFFDLSATLYNKLNIGASYNTNLNVNKFIKDKIYSNNIIFSNWRRVAFDKLDVLNIKKLTDRFNIKFNQAFIFDIDRIIYDHEKLTLKIQSPSLKVNNIKVKKFFKDYKNIVGVSVSLFFESKKIERNYYIKTKLASSLNESVKFLKNSKEKFTSSQDEKIRCLANHIAKLNKEKQTAVINVDSNSDLELLVEYLKLKKVPHEVIKTNTCKEKYGLYTILTSNKITITTDLISATLDSQLGGNFEEIAKINTLEVNNDPNSNFYKEKYKKELVIQKEIQENHKKTIQDQGGVTLIFASHYTEIKYEYIILKNYRNIPIKDTYFYNCPQDEVYSEFKLDKLNIFEKPQTQENEFLFKIFAKFVFYLRKYSINKFLIQQKGYLLYAINETQSPNQEIKKEKIGRNDPCPCGSGKKYKNCCGE